MITKREDYRYALRQAQNAPDAALCRDFRLTVPYLDLDGQSAFPPSRVDIFHLVETCALLQTSFVRWCDDCSDFLPAFRADDPRLGREVLREIADFLTDFASLELPIEATAQLPDTLIYAPYQYGSAYAALCHDQTVDLGELTVSRLIKGDDLRALYAAANRLRRFFVEIKLRTHAQIWANDGYIPHKEDRAKLGPLFMSPSGRILTTDRQKDGDEWIETTTESDTFEGLRLTRSWVGGEVYRETVPVLSGFGIIYANATSAAANPPSDYGVFASLLNADPPALYVHCTFGGTINKNGARSTLSSRRGLFKIACGKYTTSPRWYIGLSAPFSFDEIAARAEQALADADAEWTTNRESFACDFIGWYMDTGPISLPTILPKGWTF